MRGRLRWMIPAVLVAAAAGVGLATAATTSTGTGTVAAAHSSIYGNLLATARGMTLYHYTAETKGSIKCTGSCAKFWPPLLVKTKPTAGAGVTAGKLSTVRRPDGTTQVTYAGFALYRYAADTKAGDVKGQGVQHAWFAVTPAGTLAKAKSGGPVAPPITTTTTGGGGYGGYSP